MSSRLSGSRLTSAAARMYPAPKAIRCESRERDRRPGTATPPMKVARAAITANSAVHRAGVIGFSTSVRKGTQLQKRREDSAAPGGGQKEPPAPEKRLSVGAGRV